jgi:phage repressor protein C with HTH and peptisase S24 domain
MTVFDQFAHKIGVSPSMITDIRKERTNPGVNAIRGIVSTFKEINPYWLLTGEGKMIKNIAHTPEAKKEINYVNKPFEAFTPSGKSTNVSPTLGKTVSPTVSPTEYSGLPQVVTVDKKGEDNVVMVPVTARAGYLVGYGDPEFISDLPTYHIPKLYGGTFRAFEVEGHSMVPTITQGDIVFAEWVENFNDMTDDRVYVVVTKSDGILVKRVLNRVEQYGFLVCKSDAVINRRHYPNINIPPQDILEIWQAKMYLGADFSSPSDIFDRLNDLEAAIESLKQR